MMAGFGSEYVASFESEWVAGFVGIRMFLSKHHTQHLTEKPFAARLAADERP